MASTILRSGDVITIASGIFEGYDRSGPFLVVREFDLGAFVREVKKSTPVTERWEATDLMLDVPRRLLEQGYIQRLPCRRLYLGTYDDFDVREEHE
jgi:hypothetical protein